MKVKTSLACWIIFVLALNTYGQTSLVLDANRSGSIEWDTLQGDYTYSIEWSSQLSTTTTWNSSFSSLQDIHTTNSEISVAVPVYYRVIAISNYSCHSLLEVFNSATGMLGNIKLTSAVILDEDNDFFYCEPDYISLYSDTFQTSTTNTFATQVHEITNINDYVYSVVNETKCNEPVIHRPYSRVTYHYIDGTEESASCSNYWTYQYEEQEYFNPSTEKIVTNITIYLQLDLRGYEHDGDFAYLRNNRVYSPVTSEQGFIDIALPTNNVTLKSFILYATCPKRENGDYLCYEISDGISTQNNLQVETRYVASNFAMTPDTLRITLAAATNNATPKTPAISDISFIYWTGD